MRLPVLLQLKSRNGLEPGESGFGKDLQLFVLDDIFGIGEGLFRGVASKTNTQGNHWE